MSTNTMTAMRAVGQRARLGASAVMAATLVIAVAPRPASAQAQPEGKQAAPATTTTPAAHDAAVPKDAHDAAAPVAGHAAAAAPSHGGAQAADHAGAEGGHGEAHSESIWVTLARLANFAVLAGILYLLGRKPLAAHLASRSAQIRKDLVDAAALRQTATARLADIEARLAALPAELAQMRERSAHELESERARIRAVAEAERDRLVDQARREIATQTRAARVSLREHAAALAVGVAEQRLRSTLTAAEQATLVDRYAAQVRNVQ